MDHRTGIFRAQPEHIPFIARNMREADKQELWACSHSSPMEALVRSYGLSLECWVGLVEGVPICMFGVAPMSLVNGVAAPWMLGTDQLEKNALTFLKGSIKVVSAWKESYSKLYNYVDSRNKTSIRWLGWLGFDIQQAKPHGAERLPFHRFEFSKEITCVNQPR